MSFVKNSTVTFLTQIFITLAGLLISISIARNLTPSGQGIYALIMLLSAILIMVGNLGVSQSTIYFGCSKKYPWGVIANNSIITTILSSIVIITLFSIYYFFYSNTLQDLSIYLLIFILASIPFNLLMQFFTIILLGQNKIVEYNGILLLQTSVQFIFVTFSLFMVKLSITGFILAYIGSVVVSSLVSVILVWKTSGVHLRFSGSYFYHSVHFGFPGYIGNMVQFFNYRINLFIMALFLSVTQIGYYSIALILAEAVWYLPGAINKLVFAMAPQTATSTLNKMTPKICRNTFFLTVLTGVAILLAGKFMIGALYGDEYFPSLDPLYLLLPGTIVLSIGSMLANELCGRGKPVINLGISIVALIANISLNLLLIPSFGLMGAAFASTISYVITTTITLLVYTKITGVAVSDIIFIKPTDFLEYLNIISNVRKRAANLTGHYLARNLK